MNHGERPGPESTQPTRGPAQPPSESGTPGTFGSTDSSRVDSSSRGSNDHESSHEAISPAEVERSRALKDLEEITESYRGGKTSKTEAVASVLCLIGENVDVSFTQLQREETFDLYLAEILAVSPRREESRESESSGHRPDDNQGPSGASVPIPDTRKTRDAPDCELDDEDNKPLKKQQLLESDMPWYTGTGESTISYSNPSCEETCRLL